MSNLAQVDPEIADAIRHELNRQEEGLELIASENFVSPAVLEAAGSVVSSYMAGSAVGAASASSAERTGPVGTK